MPDEINIALNMKAALDCLEQYSLTNQLRRTQAYTSILTVLERDEDISLRDTERLLAICVHDKREDMRYTATKLNIINVIIARVQKGRYDPAPDLLPSALLVISITKTTALLSKAESLKQLCFDTLLSYPDDTLIAASEQDEEIMEIFNLYCHIKIPLHMKLQAFSVLHRLLKILPPEKKRQFVDKGVIVWFSKIIPLCMTVEVIKNIMSVELLELLTEELVEIDYTDCQHWHTILECICNTQKFPAIMKMLLQNGSDVWHRVWIVFIKLLKHQVTQSLSSIGTPINSMLPVVEEAFKVDVMNRCRAFECWSVLIDSFSTETNKSDIKKRIKLLLIPLRLNNAKAEETALAKFRCWWHLIEKFQNKVETFNETILILFLYFCFGKHTSSDKSMIIPGQISTAVKKQCVKALVDIVGHVDCDGCTDLPKLSGGKLIQTTNLVKDWEHWVYSLTSAIKMSANADDGLTQKQMTCLWKSYNIIIGELPENNVRKDLFSAMLSIVSDLVKRCESNSKLSELVLNVLILSLFDGDRRIKQLLKTKASDENRPLCTIIKVLLDPSLHLAYESCSFEDLVRKLRPVTDLILDPEYSSVCASRFLLQNLTATDISLTLWTAFAESIIDIGPKHMPCEKLLVEAILWPLQVNNKFTHIKVTAMTWYVLCDSFYPKLKHIEIFVKSISTFLFNAMEVTPSTTYFKMCVTLCVLKYKMNEQSCSACEKELELLHILTSRFDNYHNYEQLFPLLVDRVTAAATIIITNIHETAARYILFCMKKMIKVMTAACTPLTNVSLILSFIQTLLNSLDSLVQVESYQRFIPVIIDEIIDCSPFLLKQASTKNSILSVLKTLKSKIVESEVSCEKVKAIIDDIDKEMKEILTTQSSDKNSFTTPKPKEVKKRTNKKKEASIVNTVVENGEEYVVVKSNWKFNPRKLTEHQKEEFQRKREDIPALYQDLSQSQDEFKLVAWKTDSQDTSNSSKSESKSCSKMGSNETATVMLSNMPSSDVVPKILENFFSENVKKDSPTAAKDIPADKNVKKTQPVTPKNTKSPRMALKDRVFRNVRNLIENSEVQKENKIAKPSEDLNKSESIIKTPTQSKSADTANVVNSAPPMLSADRPSRVKRKPKKFDELHLLMRAKKSRQSLQGLKSKTEPKQSNPDTLSTASSSDAASPPVIVSVPDEQETNEVNNVQVTEDVNSTGANEVIQNNDNLPKEESDINNEPTIMNEVRKDLIELGERSTKMDLEANMNIEKNGGMENDRVQCSNEQNVEGSNENKSSTTIVETSNENNSREMIVETSTEKRLENSTEESVEISTKHNIESSTEREVEIAKGSEIAVLNNKKVETCNTVKAKKTKKDREKSNVIHEEHLNYKKDKSYDNKEEIPSVENDDKSIQRQTSPSEIEAKEPTTPHQDSKNKGTEEQKSTTKKSVRKSRIEKELAIDMVEGHPYLKMQSQKRLTRRASESAGTDRRKSLIEKLNKSKTDSKSDKKTKEKNRDSESSSSNSSLTVDDSQGQDAVIKDQTSFTDDLPYSDDVIESSQDSTITTISVKSTKKASKKVPLVTLEKMDIFSDKTGKINESQSILDSVIVRASELAKAHQESKDDSELPLNKTASEGPSQVDLTENMDTEPMEDKDLSEVVVIINDDLPAPLTISSDEIEVGPETQEVAEADTQPTDPKNFMEVDVIPKNADTSLTIVDRKTPTKNNSISKNSNNPQEDVTITLSDSAVVELEKESGASSPSSFGDEAKRKQDFLNNTLEISPIKNISPERNKKSPSPDTSSDYVVITLSSPVNSNGEPFDKCGSPEVFTEDKVSPDKRDQSPPRVEITVTNTSPSSSLSLKKNRPQVRAGGRAAQMLGLCCVPDKVQAIINQEKAETEEIKKTSSTSTPARRNLRILYNSVSENVEPTSDNEDGENFLKLRRSLPAVDSSPSGPILKRKLVEIDDATVSPASKRKRVSFHDPPVSTTVSVQKYIDPSGVRSPQNSAHKRLERQMRQHTPLKSPKRLDHAFKLDTVLNRAVESFTETTVISTPDDTQPFSLDETPVVEIVRASELNDTDPICPELVDCKDPIDNIAGELSSYAMKSLLVKELVGKVETVGDLAKMTELEVNRLCIKAPKVKVAKKVLTDYVSKWKPPCDSMENIDENIDEAIFDEPMPVPDLKTYVDNAAQTSTNMCVETEVQTVATLTTASCVQTETTPTAHTVVQTDESGSKSTADIVKSCLSERPDFVEQVSEQLENSSIQQITDKLPFGAITDVLMKKITPPDAKTLLNRVLEDQWNSSTDQNRSLKELSFIREYLCGRFDPRDLILFCSDLLKSAYDKPILP